MQGVTSKSGSMACVGSKEKALTTSFSGAFCYSYSWELFCAPRLYGYCYASIIPLVGTTELNFWRDFVFF